jgi:hypothetical protein
MAWKEHGSWVDDARLPAAKGDGDHCSRERAGSLFQVCVWLRWVENDICMSPMIWDWRDDLKFQGPRRARLRAMFHLLGRREHLLDSADPADPARPDMAESADRRRHAKYEMATPPISAPLLSITIHCTAGAKRATHRRPSWAETVLSNH